MDSVAAYRTRHTPLWLLAAALILGGLVIAEAWVERRGRSTCFFEGRLLDGAGKVLAKASSTITLMDQARVEGASKAALG